MKKFDLLVVSFLMLYGIGAIAALAIPLMAEVNIAEVEGKYREPTVQDAVNQRRIRSVQYLNLALHEAYLAGYGQAMLDFGVVSSTQPAKVIDREQEDEQ